MTMTEAVRVDGLVKNFGRVRALATSASTSSSGG
jgi:hypothetical protein